jgi:diguanylate cyclase (GGDEF)-like protein
VAGRTIKLNRVNLWFCAFAQPTTLLGVVAIIIILSGAYFLKKEQYNRAYDDGIQRGDDLARVLEERVSRIFYNADSQLLLLRQVYQRNATNRDLAHWINSSGLDNDPALRFTIVGADGKILSSNLLSAPPNVYVGDKDYFLAQINSPADDFFIGVPAIDWKSKKTVIQLSRRLTMSDGSFGGIILASFNAPPLDEFYNSIDVGQDGIISLVGSDRIVRSCGSSNSDLKAVNYIGRSVPESKLFELYRQSSSGHFWAAASTFCKNDGIRRLISYRAVDGFHLLAVVGVTEAEVFRHALEDSRTGWSRGLFFVGIILVAISMAATRERKLTTAKSALAHQARHDALTGLANRQAFVDEIGNALARLRTNNEAFGVFMLDLDRFKDVNDSLGHPTGDTLLKDTAERLKSTLNDADFLARFGGDEFAIIQRYVTKRQDKVSKPSKQCEAAVDLAKRIVGCLADPFEIEGRRISVGTSIGIALAQDKTADSNELMKRADLALYSAKAQGSNKFVFFDRKMAVQIEARQNLEFELRKAILNNELELHYQPVIEAKTRKISSIEALVRWRHPKIGLLRPREFLPVAEATDFIVSLGQWILQQACMDAVTWPPNVKVVVNLSTAQFKKSNLVVDVNHALIKSGLSPRRLEVDIAEDALSDDDGKNLETMLQLKTLGVAIALNDFGSGYASLNNLTMFPFDKIKIDRFFVSKMTKSSACAAVIATVITLGRCLDIPTVAKGVESRHEFNSLRASGVNFVQGYLFGRPCLVSELHFNDSDCSEFVEEDDRATGAI